MCSPISHRVLARTKFAPRGNGSIAIILHWLSSNRISGGTRTGPRTGVGAGFKPALLQEVLRAPPQSACWQSWRAYIGNNRARWADHPENISRAVSAEAGRV